MTKEDFEAWIKKQESKLYNYILMHVSEAQDAKDIFQDSLISIWNSRSSFQGKSSFTTFSIGIIKRRIADYYRCKKDIGVIPEDCSTQFNHEILDLKLAIKKLPLEDRKLLYMIIQMGLSYKEISDLEGIPEGTVKSRFYYIRQTLKETLGA